MKKLFLITAIALYVIASIGIFVIAAAEMLQSINANLYLKLLSLCVLTVCVAIGFLIAFLPQKLKWLKWILFGLILWFIIFGFIPLITGTVGNLLMA